MILAEDELEALGRTIGREIRLPAFFALSGPLGAGKSVLARAIGRGAGVRVAMPSPTFNMVYRYPIPRGEVVHLDLYRVDDPVELRELGWDELGHEDELVLVEWPERAGGELPADRWEVTIEPVPGSPDHRHVTFRRRGTPPPLPELADACDPEGR